MICIGGVCVPWCAIWPVLLFVWQPLWKRLPEPFQKQIIDCRDRCFGCWRKPKNNTKDKVDNITQKMLDADSLKKSDKDGLLQKYKEKQINEIESEQDWEKVKLLCQEQKCNSIVYFTANWCKPCKKVKVVFEKLLSEYSGELLLAFQIDIDKLSDLAIKQNVMALPTFQLRNKDFELDKTARKAQDLEKIFEDLNAQ